MKMNGQRLGNASATTTDTTNYLCVLNLDLKDIVSKQLLSYYT